MYFGERKISDEEKEILRKLLSPIFTYHEIIDTQERLELNHESAFEKATKEYSLALAKEYHKKISSVLKNIFICEDRELLRVIYDKLYFQITHAPDQQDYTYDYFCLVNICKKILN